MDMATEEVLKTYQNFNNQIAGHLKIKGMTYMVADDAGHLLKYLQKTNAGETEETFYSAIFSDHDFLTLRQFVPMYYGTITAGKDGNLQTYLKIENALHGLDNPNIVDIKIGQVTHDPFASEEKINREYQKYPAQREIGFRLSGMKVFNSKLKAYDCYSGDIFRSCTCYGLPQEKTLRYLRTFMGFNEHNNSTCGKNYNVKTLPYKCCEYCNFSRMSAITRLLEHLIDDLIQIINYMKMESRITFYASSLLIAYDSTKLNSVSYCTRHSEKDYLFPISNRELPDIYHTCMEKHKENDIVDGDMNDIDHEIKEHVFSGYAKQLPQLSQITDKHICKRIHVPYSLKMIDFGHTYIDLNSTRNTDTNYIFGLESLLEYFKRISREIVR